jgi:hypothetical protein
VKWGSLEGGGAEALLVVAVEEESLEEGGAETGPSLGGLVELAKETEACFLVGLLDLFLM